MKTYSFGPDELSEYEIKELLPNGTTHFVYWYENYDYGGSGEGVSVFDGKMMRYDLSNNSICGPIEESTGSVLDLLQLADPEDATESESWVLVSNKIRELIDSGEIVLKEGTQ